MLHYYTVISVKFHYYTPSVHEVGNRNTGRSAAKRLGNSREFDSAVTMYKIIKIGTLCY